MQNLHETIGVWHGQRHVIITDHPRPALVKNLLERNDGQVHTTYDGLARMGQNTDVTIIVDAA